MPPAWSQRFLANSASGTPTNRNNGGAPSREKPLPSLPTGAQESPTPPPTLIGRDGERSASTPTQAPRHHHQRSSSHPLPKFFGRKKSLGSLAGHNDTDVPLDEDLVPVLDVPTTSSPTRKGSGKRGKLEEEDKTQRLCMCCDSNVKVPRDLDKFRCMCCLTINDLIPMEEQKEEKSPPSDKKPEPLVAVAKAPVISIERTQNIIDRCVLAYLDARCRVDGQARGGSEIELSIRTPEEKEDPLSNNPTIRAQHGDITETSTPPRTPLVSETARPTSAAIKDLSDFNAFAYTRASTPPLSEARPSPHGPGPPPSDKRSQMPIRKPPPPPFNPSKRAPSQRLHPMGNPSHTDAHPKPLPSPRIALDEIEERRRYDRVKVIFRPLEDYIASSFGNYQCLNSSFSTLRPAHPARAQSENNIVTPPPERDVGSSPSPLDISEIDAKTLLLGDIGESGTWWTGKLGRKETQGGLRRKRVGEGPRRPVSSKTPNINWAELNRWYELVHSAGANWHSSVDQLKDDSPAISKQRLQGLANQDEIDDDLTEARQHAVRALLKVTENVLKRPTRPLKEPEDMRFLLIILANPSLHPSVSKRRRGYSDKGDLPSRLRSEQQRPARPNSPKQLSPQKTREGSQHSGILKRVFGLTAGATENCHRYVIGWFSRFDEEHFTKVVDLVASFVTHRIARRSNRSQSKSMLADGGLIPDLSGSALNTSVQLHSAMGLSGSLKTRADDPDQEPAYATDWQVKAAAKVMALLFTANNIWQGQRRNPGDRIDSGVGISPPARARRSGQLLHTSSFYNTLLDYQDMIADFKVWELRKDRFAFCKYPFFLSMGTKIKILEYDARRQMESKAREAYFDSVIRQREMEGHFHLRVRRDCMVDDSLRQISQAVGAGQEELKKGLRVQFTGEEGVDAGGLRKEWFLMLVRDIFDPNHGLFVYDDESHTCYFNPHSFETSDQYYLVGALLGLAIYNSTILDIALPPFAFRKLLAAAPASTTTPGGANISSLTATKGQMTYTLTDLAEFRPSLAAGLQQLRDFEGDVQETYCRDFVAPVERYGAVVDVPLIPKGEATPVTNANRHEFIDAYVRYLLDTSVTKQFEPFKRGFFQVCAGNALSLFRAEEIELLVRGSDEALDIDSLRAVAVYENWRHAQPPHPVIPRPADAVPVIHWFWELFSEASPDRQRKLLTFVTGTDRIPAVGATSLILRIVAGGDGWGGGAEDERRRFPIARTCFNMLVLWRYDTRAQLEEKLWRAVEESEGFGLK